MIYTKKVNSSVTALLLISGLLLGYQSAHARTMRVAAGVALGVCGVITVGSTSLALIGSLLEDSDRKLSGFNFVRTVVIGLAGGLTVNHAIQIAKQSSMQEIQKKNSIATATIYTIAGLSMVHWMKEMIVDNKEVEMFHWILAGTFLVCGGSTCYNAWNAMTGAGAHVS